jgi:hypothetical protein
MRLWLCTQVKKTFTDTSQTIIVGCKSGRRSAAAIDALSHVSRAASPPMHHTCTSGIRGCQLQCQPLLVLYSRGLMCHNCPLRVQRGCAVTTSFGHPVSQPSSSEQPPSLHSGCTCSVHAPAGLTHSAALLSLQVTPLLNPYCTVQHPPSPHPCAAGVPQPHQQRIGL